MLINCFNIPPSLTLSILLYCHLLIHAEIYIYIYWIHTGAMNNRRWKTSLSIYVPLTLFVRVQKFACERALETEHNWNILTPKLMTVNVVSFSFFWCSTRGPEAHSAGWWLPLLHLISIFSGPQTPSGFPRAFPSTSRLSPSPTLLQLPLDFRLDCVI